MFNIIGVLWNNFWWEPIVTRQFHYTNGIEKIATVSVTFIIGKLGTRKLIIDSDKGISPHNHWYYNELCIPFLRNTAPFQMKNKDIKRFFDLIDTIIIPTDFSSIINMYIKNKSTNSIVYENNVVPFAKKAKKENNNEQPKV